LIWNVIKKKILRPVHALMNHAAGKAYAVSVLDITGAWGNYQGAYSHPRWSAHTTGRWRGLWSAINNLTKIILKILNEIPKL
jgi:hypothetical protein